MKKKNSLKPEASAAAAAGRAAAEAAAGHGPETWPSNEGRLDQNLELPKVFLKLLNVVNR